MVKEMTATQKAAALQMYQQQLSYGVNFGDNVWNPIAAKTPDMMNYDF